MRALNFIIVIACALLLAGCKQSSTSTVMTPRIPVYNSQGLPGVEHKEHKQEILDHQVMVKDGWLQPWMDYDSLLVWSMN